MKKATTAKTQPTVTKPQPKKTGVKILEETTVAIQVGKDVYGIKTTNDGRGIRMENKQGSIFIPFGAEGKAIVDYLKKKVDGAKNTGRRRTSLELVAQGAGKKGR